MDKNELLALIATNLPDNNAAEITPALVRDTLNQMVAADVNLAELTEQILLGLLKVKSLQFDTVTPPPPWNEGMSFYDNDSKALSYYNSVSDTTINMGQEVVIKVYNNTGATIPNGASVRSSSSSVGGVPTVVMSLADTVEHARSLGLATHDIENGTVGFITAIGSVGGLDTSMYSDGDELYVDPVTPGALTNTPPSIVNRVAAVLISDVSEGKIFTSITEVVDPKAFAQNLQGATSILPVTTTPIPLEGFTDTPFFRNVNVQTPVGNEGGFRTILSPAETPYGGYYDVTFNISFTSSGNQIIVAEVYANGSPTGVKALADVSNSQIDNGSITIPRALTQVPLSPTDELEIYIYTQAGTSNLTIQSLLINSARVGNI